MERLAARHYYWPLLPGAGLVPGGGVRPGLDAGDTGVGVAGVRAVAVGDTLVLAPWGWGATRKYKVHTFKIPSKQSEVKKNFFNVIILISLKVRLAVYSKHSTQ